MKHTNDVIVGAVVLTVVAALIGAISWAKQSDIGNRRRDVVAHFRDVGNARVGNAVVIRGVVGGRIEAIELASSGWVNVRMKLDPSVQMPSDPVVLLNESSLFGDWQATVVERGALPHDASLEREVADASRDPGTLPGTSLPGIGKLTAVAGQIAGDMASVAGRFGTAFDDQAASELRASIKNGSDLLSTLRGLAQAHASDLDTLTNQLRQALLTLNRTASNVEVTAHRIDSATTAPEVRQLIDNFGVASTELRHTAVQVRELSTRLAETQGRVNTVLATTDSVMTKLNRGQGTLGLLLNDPSLYRRTDSVLAELRALTLDIKTNPKKYVSVHVF
jgi:phospholipid/cholesterol/gamma-HCH transport system substrate-binding protein